MKTKIRPESFPMQPSDLDEVLAIERSCFSTPWTRTMFLQEIDNSFSCLVVFRENARIVGYVCFWGVVDEAHLLNIAVHPELRGEGYGTAILDHLEKACREQSLQKIVLEVGRRNTEARRLYNQNGFITIGFRKRYYTDIDDDALVMEKRIEIPPHAGASSER